MKLYYQRGQALVEMVVVGPLIIAIAAGIMAMALYMQAKSTTISTARYSVWERAIWADPDRPWAGSDNQALGGGASTVLRSDYDVFQSGLAYQANPALRIRSDRNISRLVAFDEGDHDNPEVLSWGGKTQSGYRTFGGNVGAFAAGAREGSTRSAWEELHSRYAHDMTYGAQEDIYLASDSLQNFGIEPLSNRGLKLPKKSVVSADVSLKLPNVFHDAWSVAWLRFDDVSGGSEMQISSSASLLTNPWAPKNEAVFIQKVHGLDVKPLTDYVTYVNESIGSGLSSLMGSQSEILGWIPILGDISLSGNPALDSTTTALPFTRVIPGVDGQVFEASPL